MQFIQNGPDIPERLLQAQEEGRVVFFCGAGVSYPAGLPGFASLVKQIYESIGEPKSTLEQTAIKMGQLDTAVGLLEARIVGGREAVRHAVAGILKPNLVARNATSTHEALLMLARCRNGRTRLITTNFDRLFEEVIASKRLKIPVFQAPLLPIPKNRWDGLVYLHGLLSTDPTSGELDRLVLSSGDFGLAYLTERWAARFISELFRNYAVCFVGYSINDPVLRYMMDALAADRLLGESPPEMFAFGSHSKGRELKVAEEWQAKNVTPILYREHNNHAFLHKTLRVWATTYRDGVQGKESIVSNYARTHPSASTRQDDYVGRMLWALSHDSGLPAKRFADFDPAPSLDWLEPLSDGRFDRSDLPRFGVQPNRKPDAKLAFSLIRRPSPYSLAPQMMLIADGMGGSAWDDVMFHLARWLVRHLNDPALPIWLSKRGGQLHDRFIWLVENELERFAKLERDGNTSELDRIRSNAPNAVPRPLMKTVWRLLLSGRVKQPWRALDLYRWKDRLMRDGLTVTLRLELRELLAPRITLKEPFRWQDDNTDTVEPERLKQLVDWELTLADDNVHHSLNDLANSEHWRVALPTLIDDFQQLLRDALDLLRELGEADNLRDRSHWDLPSISPHWQNRGFRDWVSLIELLRDSWLAIHQVDSARAAHIAENWFSQAYPTFKRLAFFAASYSDCISSDNWVSWLLADDYWWLWSVDTQRETMRLLVLQGDHLSGRVQDQLESAILSGPPRKMYRDGIEPEHWKDLVEHSQWLHLAKLASGGCVLGDKASKKLMELSEANPGWRLAANESDEFSHWMSGTGDPDYEPRREIDRAPLTRTELMVWLQKPLADGPFSEHDWREVCRERFVAAAHALFALGRKNIWPVERWREALQAWSEEATVKRSWSYLAPMLARMPNDILAQIAQGATWWLEASSKKLNKHEAIFFDLCNRFLRMVHPGELLDDRPVTQAINHPIGHVTQALLNFWFREEPNDNEGLPDNFKELFTLLFDGQQDQYRHGRVLLASRLIALFRVDRKWTEQYLLRSMSWHQSTLEAHATWEGFLWSPRLYQPLLAAFKTDFLETARHYNELGEHAQQYAAILTFASLDSADTLTIEELHQAISTLPPEGLQESANSLVQALEGAGEQREQYWLNRIYPYLKRIWPKSKQLASSPIAQQLSLLAIAARGEFPAAVAAVRGWLLPVEHPHYVIHRLHESGLSARFPQDSLIILDAIIDDQPWIGQELSECLTAIVQSWPQAEQDLRYQRLLEHSRR